MERLAEKTVTRLLMQQRIPEGYSATEAEHKWHDMETTPSLIVDGHSPGSVLEKAHAMMDTAPDRKDTEYRVILVVTSQKSWALL